MRLVPLHARHLKHMQHAALAAPLAAARGCIERPFPPRALGLNERRRSLLVGGPFTQATPPLRRGWAAIL